MSNRYIVSTWIVLVITSYTEIHNFIGVDFVCHRIASCELCCAIDWKEIAVWYDESIKKDKALVRGLV